MPLLRRGQVLTSGDGSRWYAVGDPLGQGGFAQAFSGWLIDRSGRRRRRVCIKVTSDATSWHGESYFGQLLLGDPRVVGLIDSFPHQSRFMSELRTRYVLVFELERETVKAWFARGGTPWTESGAQREPSPLVRTCPLRSRGTGYALRWYTDHIVRRATRPLPFGLGLISWRPGPPPKPSPGRGRARPAERGGRHHLWSAARPRDEWSPPWGAGRARRRGYPAPGTG